MARQITSFLGTAGLALLSMSSPARAQPVFDRIVVFGDSLSDSGNAGRSSNGPVWVEYLAMRLGVALKPSRAGGLNFSVGGARLSRDSGPISLRAQADAYLRSNDRAANTLQIVYGGGNDVLDALAHPHADAMIRAAVESLQTIVADLVERGATDILVPNLPDVGITPAVQSRGNRAVEEAGARTQRFNRALDQALAGVARAPGLRIHRLDVEQLADLVRRDPAASGFRDISRPCSERPSCDGYLFWDHVHPTTEAHQRLSDAAFQVFVRP